MKKGFTLIELLAVILILSLIAAISYPIVVNNIRSSKESAAASQEKMLINAAKYWVNDNSHLLSDEVGAVYRVTVSDLKTGKYLDARTIKDIESGQNLTNACVRIETEEHRYIYTFEKVCQ